MNATESEKWKNNKSCWNAKRDFIGKHIRNGSHDVDDDDDEGRKYEYIDV